jgi:hypothetical protein
MSTAITLIGQLTNAEGDLSGKVQVVAVIVTLLLLALVLELVRRRRLIERYALLWILAAFAMVILAVWRGGLKAIGDVIGVADPVNAIFLVAFAVVFALLIHFSVAISRLSEETKILAQVVSRLDAELRGLRGRGPGGNGGRPAVGDGISGDESEELGPAAREAAEPHRPEG